MSVYPSVGGNWPARRQPGVHTPEAIAPRHLIREARPVDVIDILALISPHVAAGTLLPRNAGQIFRALDDWVVAERSDGFLMGCGSLVTYNPALAELRSLVVAPSYHGMGLGREIVMALLQRAQAQGIRDVFTLTRVGPFFERLGFAPAHLDQFPDKARQDCALCPRQHCCDEAAFVYHLE